MASTINGGSYPHLDARFSSNPGLLQFFTYARNGDTKGLKRYIDKVNVNAQDWNGSPALYLAITAPAKRSLELIETLLEAGADPNMKVREDHADEASPLRTIFHYLVREHGDEELELIQLFLKYQASILTKDSDGNTVLGIALRQEQHKVVRAILDHALTTVWDGNQKKFYQLCNLIANDNLEEAKQFASNIEDIKFSEMEEVTPERFALAMGKHKFVKMFIDLKNKK